MAKRTPPPDAPSEGGKVIPFARPHRSPRRPPPPPVYGSRLEADLEEAKQAFDKTAASLEGVDFDAEIAKADEAVARGEPNAREGRAAVLLARACRAFGRGEVPRAIEEASAVIEEHPDYIDALNLRATFHARLGDEEAALRDLDHAVELAPRDPDRYMKRAGYYEHIGDHDRALANFIRAQQLAPESPEAHAGVARCANAGGDERAAIRAYTRAIKLSPRNAAHYFMRGILHEKAERTELALDDYSRSLSLYENQTEVWASRGRCRLKLGQNEAAIADFTRVVQAEPDNWLGHRGRADALLGLERYDEALPDLAVAIGSDESGASHWMRGRVHEHRGDDDAALPDYEEAVRRTPEHVQFVSSLFAVHMRKGMGEEALADIDRLVALMPDSTMLLLTRARVRAAYGRREQAIEDFDRVIAEEPTNAPVIHERAERHRGFGNDAKARDDFARAYELAPDHAAIRCSWGEISFMGARTEEEKEGALALITSSADLDPTNPGAWFRAGETLRRMARHDRAIPMLDRCIALEPRAARAFVERAIAKESLHYYDDDPAAHEADVRSAIADVEAAMALSEEEDVNLYERRGELYEDLGDLDRALADFEKVIELCPDSIDGYMDRGRVREARGDLEGARADQAVVDRMEEEWRAELPEELRNMASA